MDSPRPVHLRMRASIESSQSKETMLRVIEKSIENGQVVFRARVPGDLVAPVEVLSIHPEVTIHELRTFLAIENQEAALRALPDAARRKEERRQARREATQKVLRIDAFRKPCPGCGGRGGTEDSEGNWESCPMCRP